MFFFLIIGVWLLYNVVTFCCTMKWIIYMYTYISSLLNLHPTLLSHPFRSSQSVELSSLCYTADSHQLYILHIIVCICQYYSLSSSYPPLPLLWLHVCSLCLCLYSCPANRFICTIFPEKAMAPPMDGGAWWATVHGVAKSRTWLSNFTFTFHFDALEKEMATHSSVLAWRIPGTGEPGGLPSMGSHRVGHNWSDLAAAAVPFFWIQYICINIWYLFFSFWFKFTLYKTLGPSRNLKDIYLNISF